VVSENFGLGVGYSLFENVGQKMLHFSFCQSRSVTLKYATNAFAAGAYDAPQTPKLAGEADTGYPSPHPTSSGPAPSRLWRSPVGDPHCFFDKSNTESRIAYYAMLNTDFGFI